MWSGEQLSLSRTVEASGDPMGNSEVAVVFKSVSILRTSTWDLKHGWSYGHDQESPDVAWSWEEGDFEGAFPVHPGLVSILCTGCRGAPE